MASQTVEGRPNKLNVSPQLILKSSSQMCLRYWDLISEIWKANMQIYRQLIWRLMEGGSKKPEKYCKISSWEKKRHKIQALDCLSILNWLQETLFALSTELHFHVCQQQTQFNCQSALHCEWEQSIDSRILLTFWPLIPVKYLRESSYLQMDMWKNWNLAYWEQACV